ncbi:hypothetical protein [Rhodopila sp.]|uniref:hypothetical protein n=1 Tax=Rhodopila sp. TaxID=2480087 RepID=UPI003D1055CD
MGLWLITSAAAYAGNAELGCPPTHNGKSLKDVGLFDGDPLDQGELMPEWGRFVVPSDPPASRSKIPSYTLGCFYDRWRKELVTVVLSRDIRVCEFPHYSQVQCH